MSNKKFKKSVSLFSLNAIFLSSALAACTNTGQTDYDLGDSSAALNSLNYVRYESAKKAVGSLVDGFIKDAPNKSLYEIFSPPKVVLNITPLGTENPGTDNEKAIDYSYEELLNNKKTFKSPTKGYSSFELKNFGLAAAAAKESSEAITSWIAFRGASESKYLSSLFVLNEGLSQWANFDEVNAMDFLDFVHYVFDINTGSQLLIDLLDFNFFAGQDIYNAQNTYISETKKVYQNPFGKYPYVLNNSAKNNKLYEPDKPAEEYVLDPNFVPWKSTLKDKSDQQWIEVVKKAALSFGFKTGNLFLNINNKDFFASAVLPENQKFLEHNLKTETIDGKEKQIFEIKDAVQEFTFLNPNYDEKTNNKVPKLLKKKIIRNEYFNNVQVLTYDKTEKHFKWKYDLFAKTRFEFQMYFEKHNPISVDRLAFHFVLRNLKSINRKFVETKAGGILNFGTGKDSFLTNSAFEIEDLVLGENGYMLLKKNPKYYASQKTVANLVKVYFQADPNITSLLFEDRYIGRTDVPSTLLRNFWKNDQYKPLLHKQSGYGSLVLQLNLDQETNKDSPIQDINLRKAIYYALNRQTLISLAGWDFSFPVNQWTAPSTLKSSSGTDFEFFLNESFYNAENKKIFPLISYDHLTHQGKNYEFEIITRKDRGFDLETAKYFLEKYKKDHPKDQKGITLRFITDGTPEKNHVGDGLKYLFNKAFGDYVKLDIKPLPENIYSEYAITGKFDLIYSNLDKLSNGNFGELKSFFIPDEINTKEGKTTGFRTNPAGGFVYNDIFTKNNEKLLKAVFERLEIPQMHWSKLQELSKQKKDEDLKTYRDRIDAFFNSLFTDEENKQGWTNRELFKFAVSLEKIIREFVPIIPLFEIDTKWSISTIQNPSTIGNYAYSYDIRKIPKVGLPAYITSN